jgi:RNA polymerase sigma-70 factor, ECF subfamily
MQQTREVSVLLAELRSGSSDALARLVPVVYRELRRLAGGYLRNERVGHTLQPTALVHEVYVRLAGQDHTEWQNRAQFMGVAAQIMRRILVDYARERAAAKRGGTPARIDHESRFEGPEVGNPDEILAVHEALGRLCELDAQQARVVELRYFCGMNVEEAAAALGVSPRTVKRDWAMAKRWLRIELTEGRP